MRKRAVGATLGAVVGFSALTAAPASALSFPTFDTCDAAAAAGVYNIPADDPRYLPGLDSDADGVACENPNYEYIPLPPMDPPVYGVPSAPQMEQMPVGGADTGVSMAPESSGTGVVAIGLVGLAMAVGGVLMARKRRRRA